MDRGEALAVLKLDQRADGQAVNAAYWRSVRRAQSRSSRDGAGAGEIDELNRAYAVLAPRRSAGSRRPPPHISEAPHEPGDDILAWFGREAARTRARWVHRNPEIALIGGCALFLALLALGAGASFIAVAIASVVLCAAIWAPWRRPHTAGAADQSREDTSH